MESFSIENPFFLYDLNLLTIFITSFYSIVYSKLKERYPSSKFQNWVSAFCLASELSRNGDDSLKREILSIMNELGISQQEWINLQVIRKLRNELCHPKVGINRVISILNQRWKSHSSYTSLRKMLKIVRAATQDVTPNSSRPPSPKRSEKETPPHSPQTFKIEARPATDTKNKSINK
jgi:hypothetical protein